MKIDRGALLCLILSLSILFLFFGKLILHANSVYFSKSGDGFLTYYTSQYHVKYDKQLFHDGSMNYPFGENVFFTTCQPGVSNFIKCIQPVIDLSNYITGITNLLMLFSIVFSALFLYLIFKNLKLPYWYAAIAATAIAFLSPQMHRLGGHFTLAYQFAIPCYIYLLMLFYNNPSIKKSLFIGVLTFLMAVSHMYFLVFFAFLMFPFWGMLILFKKVQFKNLAFFVKHTFLQFILPFLLLELFIHIDFSVTDRTSEPWGFLIFRSNFDGIFYPFGMLYEDIVKSFHTPSLIEWEGVSYSGIVGIITILILSIQLIGKLVKRKFREVLKVSDNKLLTVFFAASMAALLFSFGFPFVFPKLHWMWDYAGIIKQFRGIGRFAWLFYYLINILAFYVIYGLVKNAKKQIVIAVQIISLMLVSMDAYSNIYWMQEAFNNRLPLYEDKANALPENRWMNTLDTSLYQAILPLPYFHVGSENVWLDASSEIKNDAFAVSLKTGLPLMAVTSGRTSLSQTYKSIELVLEPSEGFSILKELPNQKPLLVIARSNQLTINEKAIVAVSKLLFETENYNVYALSIDGLTSLTKHLYEKNGAVLAQAKTFTVRDFQVSDSLGTFIYESFNNNKSDTAFMGGGCIQGDSRKYISIYDEKVTYSKNRKWVYSFWMYDFKKDLYPRSIIEVALCDASGKVYKANYNNPHRLVKMFIGNWALLEDTFALASPTDKIKITVWNDELGKHKKLLFDELLIRPSNIDVYKKPDQYIFKNNRYYYSK